jgi:hypothetical protein
VKSMCLKRVAEHRIKREQRCETFISRSPAEIPIKSAISCAPSNPINDGLAIHMLLLVELSYHF